MSFIRQLSGDDFERLDAFLQPRTDTSLFMRSNARRGGFRRDPNRLYSADYYGLFDDEILQGVIALCWQGSLLIQVPDLLAIPRLLETALKHESDFKVSMILGPSEQVLAAVDTLSTLMPDLPQRIVRNSAQKTYTLTLDHLIIPAVLTHENSLCRLAHPSDLETLVPWRMAYDKELLNIHSKKDDVIQNTLNFIEDQATFVLEVSGNLVARTDFNAKLPDTVQIGGVWVPLDQRNKGYARAAIAGSLLAAQKQGATQAVLFTEGAAAARCYQALGFQEKGTYHFVILA